ncbi:MAG: hypothetical protein AB7O62_17855, partial [Pirellulales bacterium]
MPAQRLLSMDMNPYASPGAAPEPFRSSHAPLYAPPSVLLATFLGSLLGGAILMAINFQRLGRSTAGWVTLILGLGATVLLLAVVMMIPDDVPIPAVVWTGLQMAGM